jgi:glycosyltransferase involved in cell wall biosynthesis
MRGPEIHLIADWRVLGGAEMRAFELHRALSSSARVRAWSEYEPAPELARMLPIDRIHARLFRFPRRGVFVFIGVYFHVGRWVLVARPSRTILLYNTLSPESLSERLGQVSADGQRPVELVYASDALRRITGRGGMVQDSIIDIRRFAPRSPAAGRESPPGRFVVGRASRDVPYKHAESDPELYARLAERGCEVRIAGGSCLGDRLGAVPGVTLLPFVAQERLPAFFHELDCFVFRTSSRWYETFGRVVAEAMACGVPVVCERDSGAADYVAHGETGFLVDTDQEAFDAIIALKNDPALRARIGDGARRAMAERYSDGRVAAIRDFYLAGARTSMTSDSAGERQ